MKEDSWKQKRKRVYYFHVCMPIFHICYSTNRLFAPPSLSNTSPTPPANRPPPPLPQQLHSAPGISWNLATQLFLAVFGTPRPCALLPRGRRGGGLHARSISWVTATLAAISGFGNRETLLPIIINIIIIIKQ